MAEHRPADQRYDDELAEQVRNEDTAKRLISIPGIGVLTATALVAAVGNAQTFSCGRDLAAWLGLVPRQATTGGKPRLLHISKRGNGYLRMLLIHGARTSLPGSCCGGILYASRPADSLNGDILAVSCEHRPSNPRKLVGQREHTATS